MSHSSSSNHSSSSHNHSRHSSSSRSDAEKYSADFDQSPKPAPTTKTRAPIESSPVKSEQPHGDFDSSLKIQSSPLKRTSYDPTPKSQALEMKQLQTENLELRNQLKALNSRINDILERPIKRNRPDTSENQRGKAEQLRIAEQKLKVYQQEHLKVKVRHAKAIEANYIDSLTKEVDFKASRIHDLESKLKITAGKRKGREKTMEKLLVQGDEPELLRRIHELTAECHLYAAKVEEVQAEAKRKQSVLEAFKESEAALLKRAENLQQKAPIDTKPSDESIMSAQLLPQYSELTRAFEVFQRSTLSKERNFKRKEGQLAKQLETLHVTLAEAKNSLYEKGELLEQLSRDLREISSVTSSALDFRSEDPLDQSHGRLRPRNTSNIKNRSFNELPQKLPLKKSRVNSAEKIQHINIVTQVRRYRGPLRTKVTESKSTSKSSLPPVGPKKPDRSQLEEPQSLTLVETGQVGDVSGSLVDVALAKYEANKSTKAKGHKGKKRSKALDDALNSAKAIADEAAQAVDAVSNRRKAHKDTEEASDVEESWGNRAFDALAEPDGRRIEELKELDFEGPSDVDEGEQPLEGVVSEPIDE